MIDRARADGVAVTMDSYPYIAASTYLWAILPSWAYRGGDEALLARLRDPATRERLRHEVEAVGNGRGAGSAGGLVHHSAGSNDGAGQPARSPGCASARWQPNWGDGRSTGCATS